MQKEKQFRPTDDILDEVESRRTDKERDAEKRFFNQREEIECDSERTSQKDANEQK